MKSECLEIKENLGEFREFVTTNMAEFNALLSNVRQMALFGAASGSSAAGVNAGMQSACNPSANDVQEVNVVPSEPIPGDRKEAQNGRPEVDTGRQVRDLEVQVASLTQDKQALEEVLRDREGELARVKEELRRAMEELAANRAAEQTQAPIPIPIPLHTPPPDTTQAHTFLDTSPIHATATDQTVATHMELPSTDAPPTCATSTDQPPISSTSTAQPSSLITMISTEQSPIFATSSDQARHPMYVTSTDQPPLCSTSREPSRPPPCSTPPSQPLTCGTSRDESAQVTFLSGPLVQTLSSTATVQPSFDDETLQRTTSAPENQADLSAFASASTEKLAWLEHVAACKRTLYELCTSPVDAGAMKERATCLVSAIVRGAPFTATSMHATSQQVAQLLIECVALLAYITLPQCYWQASRAAFKATVECILGRFGRISISTCLLTPFSHSLYPRSTPPPVYGGVLT